MGITFNPQTGRYESTDGPPKRGYTKSGVQGGRGGSPVKGEAGRPKAPATSNLYSPRAGERMGATWGQADVGTADTSMEDVLAGIGGGGGGGGVNAAAARRGGFQSANIMERFGRQAQKMYNTQAGAIADQLRQMYEPVFAQQQTAADTQRQALMDFLGSQYEAGTTTANTQAQAALDALAQQYNASRGQIDSATQAALAAIPTKAAGYSEVPIVELAANANPLLTAISSLGADTAAVQQQQTADQQLAAQLAGMARTSGQQLNAAQQALLDTARSAAQGYGSRALTNLELGRSSVASGIEGQRQQALGSLLGTRSQGELQALMDYQQALNNIVGGRAQTAADIAGVSQGLITKGLESMLGARENAAQTRAETVAKYGPAPKPKGKGKGKGKGGK